MTPGELLTYLGGAAGYALTATVVVAAVMRVLAGRWPRPAHAALALATLFVFALGLHPLPDPAALDCSAGGAEKLLRPFGYLQYYAAFWERQRPLWDWLTARAIMAPVMNVLLFVPVGLALGRCARSWRVALVYGMGVTLFIELSQLSALWGIYPCPYRRFEVDDLTHNTAGILLGFALARRRTAGPPPS